MTPEKGGDERKSQEESPVGILAVDPSGEILETNPALLRLLGSPSPEATRKINVLSYLPLVQAGVAGDFRRAIERSVFVRSEREYTSKWGKTLVMKLSVMPVLDAEGKVCRVQALVEDQTAARAEMDILRIQRDLGRSLASAASRSAAFELLLDAALSVAGVDCGCVHSVADGALELGAHRRLSAAFVATIGRLDPEERLAGLVASGLPVHRRQPDLGLPDRDAVTAEGLRSISVLPVRHEGSALASLVAGSHSEEELSAPARAALESIADVGGILARIQAGEGRPLAIQDPLTGLYNREGLLELGSREMKRAARLRRPVYILVLNLDSFREVGRHHGEAVRDEVVKNIAGRCRASVRAIDVVGRPEEDEFCIVLPENDPASARTVAERVRQAVAGRPIPTSAGEFDVSISVGVGPVEGVEADLLAAVEKAYAALAAAGGSGAGGVLIL